MERVILVITDSPQLSDGQIPKDIKVRIVSAKLLPHGILTLGEVKIYIIFLIR